jgi:hypothetical protein
MSLVLSGIILRSFIPFFSTPIYTFNYKIWISVSVFLYLCFFSFPSTIIHHGALACLSVVHVPSSSSSMVRVFSSCVCRPFSRVVFPRLLIWLGLGPSTEGPSRMNVAEGEIWSPATTPLAVTYTCHHNHQPYVPLLIGRVWQVLLSAQEEKGRVHLLYDILIINLLYF